MIDFKKFNSVISLTSYFNSDEKCKQAIIESRWADGDVVCPYCGGHHCVVPQIQNMTNLSRVTVWRWVKKYDWVLTPDNETAD